MAVAAPAAAFDRCVERDREGARIALVAVRVVGDRHQRLGGRHDDERDAVQRVLAEIGVQGLATDRLDVVDDLLLNGCSGAVAISWFQALVAGKTGHPPRWGPGGVRRLAGWLAVAPVTIEIGAA